MELKRVHQISSAIIALMLMVSCLWVIVSFYSVSSVVSMLFILGLCAILVTSTVFADERPYQWFPMLKTPFGAGVYLMFLGFILLGSAGLYGFIVALVAILHAGFSIVWGLINKELTLAPYNPIFSTRTYDADESDDTSFTASSIATTVKTPKQSEV